MYSPIATHFSETRYKPWPGVVQFLKTLEPNTHVLDLGCGNGKYLAVRSDLNLHACDICPELVDIAKARYPQVSFLICDICSLPYSQASMDTVYSVAVFHHLKTLEERQQCLKEVTRVLKPEGQFFLTVWASSAIQDKWTPLSDPGDFHVPWNDKYTGEVVPRYYHIFEKSEILKILEPMFEVLEIWEECKNWYIRCQKRKGIPE
jgi:ubiquinone/menaquinone biosynthesis C-methylase UbiE